MRSVRYIRTRRSRTHGCRELGRPQRTAPTVLSFVRAALRGIRDRFYVPGLCRGGPPWHRCPVKDESCPRFFGYEICGWALLPLGEGGPRAKRKGRMRGQFQLSKRAPHPPLRGTFSPWEKGQTTPSFLTLRFRATAFQNRLTGQRYPPWPPGLAAATISRLYSGGEGSSHHRWDLGTTGSALTVSSKASAGAGSVLLEVWGEPSVFLG